MMPSENSVFLTRSLRGFSGGVSPTGSISPWGQLPSHDRQMSCLIVDEGVSEDATGSGCLSMAIGPSLGLVYRYTENALISISPPNVTMVVDSVLTDIDHLFPTDASRLECYRALSDALSEKIASFQAIL